MTAGERFKNWIEGLSESWKDRLRGWFVSWVVGGMTDALEDMNPEQKSSLDDLLKTIVDDPNTPPYLSRFLGHSTERGNPLIIVAAVLIVPLMLLPMITGAFAPLGNLWNYVQERKLHTFRIDPMSVITAWRRDPEKYAGLFDDLKDQGWSDERIEALKFFTLYYPSPAELIHWQAREVFEPEMIARYGLDAELGAVERDAFYKAGMSDEQITNHWRAHWEHASWMQVVEMLHRGQLKEEEVWDWFRVVEIPPYWRDKLIAISWNVPTRVDVRRWWDMRTIDEAELRDIYGRQGYHDKDLDNYILWTKVYVAFPDLMARWSKGWITLDQVRAELTGLGMPAERVEEMIQTKIEPAGPERVSGERDLTKSDIYKGVKQDKISRAEGMDLLMDLGFDEDEADLLLATNIPADQVDTVVKQRDLTKADILKGLKTTVITRDEAMTRLRELRYSPVDAEFLLKIFDAQVTPPTESREREASKADIIAAVKMGLITPEDAYLMLIDIGFTPEASEFILAVRAETTPFSPINYAEFKDLTAKYKRAIGRGERPMTEELKKASEEVVRVTGEVEVLERSIAEEKRGLVSGKVLPEGATKRLTDLEVSLHRAEAELARVKSEYNRLLAEWRHGG